MSEKRRDNKGRILRTGESQRKNGMYEFRYTDANKKRRSIWFWAVSYSFSSGFFLKSAI